MKGRTFGDPAPRLAVVQRRSTTGQFHRVPDNVDLWCQFHLHHPVVFIFTIHSSVVRSYRPCTAFTGPLVPKAWEIRLTARLTRRSTNGPCGRDFGPYRSSSRTDRIRTECSTVHT